MSILSLRLPDSLHRQIRELADENNISINQLITLAVAEKVAALRTVAYLEERAARGDRERYLAILDKAPAVEPESYDRLDPEP